MSSLAHESRKLVIDELKRQTGWKIVESIFEQEMKSATSQLINTKPEKLEDVIALQERIATIKRIKSKIDNV